LDGASTSSTLVNINPKESARNNIVRELVETERKYVQDLEIMQVRHFVLSRNLQRLISCRNTRTPYPKATA